MTPNQTTEEKYVQSFKIWRNRDTLVERSLWKILIAESSTNGAKEHLRK
jgi:hypothetical protein